MSTHALAVEYSARAFKGQGRTKGTLVKVIPPDRLGKRRSDARFMNRLAAEPNSIVSW
jgi:hypothetical protein